MAPTTLTDHLRAQIDCFNPEAKATKELKVVITNFIEAANLEGDDLREALVEDLPAGILFSWENKGASGAVGCRILRDLLVHRCMQFIQAPNRRIHRSLIDIIYPDPEERLSAIQISDAQTFIAEQHKTSINIEMQGRQLLCVTRERVPYIARTILVHRCIVNSNTIPFIHSHFSQNTAIKVALQLDPVSSRQLQPKVAKPRHCPNNTDHKIRLRRP
jgi:hypothetical protein